MNVRNTHDKFFVILFLYFILVSQLVAAPRNGAVMGSLYIDGIFEALGCTKDGITKNLTETATFYNVQTDPASCEFDGDVSYQFASCSVVAAKPIPTFS